ncbi:hypothetical protein BAE44_0012400 [Dichanthelium oligosanthes]|uniref:Uncharacterized protein n=1 Tax=Dichanthelium oligosanthes TaxID=888268 RepID=A0A1E5VN76_9POAL|nr:hypothetical protein BAE44_0012400 [Dichanthelium oligosanthes]
MGALPMPGPRLPLLQLAGAAAGAPGRPPLVAGHRRELREAVQAARAATAGLARPRRRGGPVRVPRPRPGSARPRRCLWCA